LQNGDGESIQMKKENNWNEKCETVNHFLQKHVANDYMETAKALNNENKKKTIGTNHAKE